jgi:hypothetical protein
MGAQEMTEERWIIVPGFPGYRVSDMGRVQSRKVVGRVRDRLREEWRDMKGSRHKSGHYSVGLRRDGKTFSRYIHRLVLELFVGPCPAGMECLHEGDDPADNRLCKLRWGTHQENIREAVTNGCFPEATRLFGDDHPRIKVSDAACEEIRVAKGAGESVKSIAARHGITTTHVYRIVLGQCRTIPAGLAGKAV